MSDSGPTGDHATDGHDHARPRYLTAKRSVDDRARNRRVRERLRQALPESPTVVEAGCGVGLAVPSLFEWGVAPRSYHGVDTDGGIVSFARALVPRELRRRGHDVVETPEGCRVASPTAGESNGTDVVFEQGDALSRLPAVAPDGGADLLVAQSFFDLVPTDAGLDAAARALSPDGVAYAPLTFDGATRFTPAHPADAAVLAAFHDDIDTGAGPVRAATALVDGVRRRGGRVLAVGASDWAVTPVTGTYPADERSFLACILGFVSDAVGGQEVDGFEDWVATRRRQLRSGDLGYVARNYDVLWRPASFEASAPE
jgi:hypothetical protein